MSLEIRGPEDIEEVSNKWAKNDPSFRNGKSVAKELPNIMSVNELYTKEFPVSEMQIEAVQPKCGASLINGAAKSGKTLFAVQQCVAVASGASFLDYYRVLKQGASMIVEQDDPAGAGSIKAILQRSGAPASLPMYIVPKVGFSFGPDLLEWLETQIKALSLTLVVLDSYTSLRGPRGSGIDIVKAEQGELALLDSLAKRLGCAIAVIHHCSKGSAGLDWSEKAAGTFAMSAATESQIFISRFSEFDGAAPERLVRIRGRHSEDLELVIRFRAEKLNYEFVLAGGAAPLFPLLRTISDQFGTEPFGPKEFSHATGVSRATATRQIERLYRGGAIQKRKFGEYFCPKI